ncbi:hypothetical protein ACERIT_00135 [Halopenitus sp. H-Gu1]|uniref:DUF7108 domain-containing protein n=1 Tax=Halopenitus sp. H-Gu1 TaxID=3242697 RepID=UPI00359EE502
MTEGIEGAGTGRMNGDDGGEAVDAGERVPDMPGDVTKEAERLTRLARNATDPDAADAYRDRRSELVAEHEYTPRVREDDDTLVLYPSEWVEDGTVKIDRIEETDRAVERSLSGAGDPDRYRTVAEKNAEIVARVDDAYGPDHAANVRAYGEFLENHHVRSLPEATIDDREEFLTEYYPRNAWPTDDQRAIVERSLAILSELLEE